MFRHSFALTPAVAGAVKAARILFAAVAAVAASAASAADAATAAALFDGARS
jgi:hypothetical protein